MHRALLFLGLGLSVLCAQQPKQNRPPATAKPTAGAKPSTYPLAALQVRGAEKLQDAKIIEVLGLKIGQHVTEADFQKARERLLASGAFESVGFEYKPNTSMTGYDATFEVVETRPMFRYVFEDLPDTLRAALSREEPLFGDEIPATQRILERFRNALNKELVGKMTVEGRLTNTAPGEGLIVFRPAGARSRIAEVHFTGNDVIVSAQLTEVFSGASFGTEFSDAGVRRLLDTFIRPLYEARGRLRVKFGAVTSETTKQQGVVGVSVTTVIDEGAEYKFATARFLQADGSPLDTKRIKELNNTANFHEGELANFDEIKAGLDRVTRSYQRNGYLHAALKVDREIRDTAQLVDLAITLQPGAQYFYGKLTIRGLDILSEPAIRKMWGTREGKPFDPQYPDAFLTDIRDQAMFENLGKTEATSSISEERKTVEVTLDFKGARKPKTDPFGK